RRSVIFLLPRMIRVFAVGNNPGNRREHTLGDVGEYLRVRISNVYSPLGSFATRLDRIEGVPHVARSAKNRGAIIPPRDALGVEQIADRLVRQARIWSRVGLVLEYSRFEVAQDRR